MALKKKLNFLWTLALYLIATRLPKAFGNDVPRVPSILDPNFINAFLNIHNELRRKVQPPAADMNQVFWDQKLAKLAKAWTRECKLAHNPCISKQYGCLLDYDFIGENIYLGEIETQPEDVVNNWYNENTDYNFVDNTCSKICRNYTQLVWAKTFKIGCAVSNCPNLNRYSAGLFVCNYSPTGNFIDFRPYRKGDPCSMCGRRKCENSLCHIYACNTRGILGVCIGMTLVIGSIIKLFNPTWDVALSRTARAWGEKCMYSRNTHLDKLHESHPVFTEIGENMWVGPVEDFTVTTAIRSWHEERKSYSYLNDTCVEDQNYSHYIQAAVYSSSSLAIYASHLFGIMDLMVSFRLPMM